MKKSEDVGIVGNLDLAFVKSLGNFPVNLKQRAEIWRLTVLAEKTKDRVKAAGTTSRYKELLQWFVSKATPTPDQEKFEEVSDVLKIISER